MKKIIIIGCPGGGKSRLARELHALTEIPLYHLDLMYWNADRTIVEKPIFLERLAKAMSGESWIIDGNYSSTMEMRIAACDTVIFFDIPTKDCLDGIKARRGIERPDMPWRDAPEDDDEQFTEYIRRYNEDNKPRVMELIEKYNEKTVVVFKSRLDADEYINNMK